MLWGASGTIFAVCYEEECLALAQSAGADAR